MATQVPPVTRAVAEQIRLLIVEPEGCSCSLREMAHGRAGSGIRVVHEFHSISAAAAALGRDRADLVVADIGDDPHRALLQLSGDPAFNDDIPFVVIDTSFHEDIEQAALKIGAQDYLVKPELDGVQFERAIRWAVKRARTLRELKMDNDLFQVLMQHVPDRIYFKDRQSRFMRVSRSVAEAYHFSSVEELTGKSDFALYPSGQAEETFRDEQRIIETGEPLVGDVGHRTLPDGTDVWVSSTKLPLRNHRGRIVGTFGITRDVTALKNLEIALEAERAQLNDANDHLSSALEKLQRAHDDLQKVQLQLIEAEKLKSIGSMAAGIAHEVKNPLAVLTLGVEFLSGKYSTDETTMDVLRELADAISRADGVIKGLLDFSAPRQLNLQECDLNTIVRTALRLVRGEVQKGAHEVDLQLGEIPMVTADRSKTCQVFLNLFTNALHAMPDGGTLTIRTQLSESSPGDPATDAHDPMVVVSISDTGTGIPPHVLDHIFEPFFTTKPSGSGSGLGMSVVQSIMNLQRGTIRMQNGEHRGAIATLTFPVNES